MPRFRERDRVCWRPSPKAPVIEGEVLLEVQPGDVPLSAFLRHCGSLGMTTKEVSEKYALSTLRSNGQPYEEHRYIVAKDMVVGARGRTLRKRLCIPRNALLLTLVQSERCDYCAAALERDENKNWRRLSCSRCGRTGCPECISTSICPECEEAEEKASGSK